MIFFVLPLFVTAWVYSAGDSDGSAVVCRGAHCYMWAFILLTIWGTSCGVPKE